MRVRRSMQSVARNSQQRKRNMLMRARKQRLLQETQQRLFGDYDGPPGVTCGETACDGRITQRIPSSVLSDPWLRASVSRLDCTCSALQTR